MGPVVTLDILMKVSVFGAVAFATGLVALVLLAADPRRNWNQWLAFFLFLVCGNFAAQGLHALLAVWLEAGQLGPVEAEHLGRALLSAGYAFLAFDPAVLAYFVSLFPRRSVLTERRWGLAVLGAPALTFLAFEVFQRRLSTPTGPMDPVRLAFFAYLGACYAYAAWRVLASYLREPSSVMAQQLRVVALGVIVVSVTRLALLFEDVVPDLEPIPSGVSIVASLAFRLVTLWGAYALLRWWMRRQSGPARLAEAGATMRVAALLFAAFTAIWSVNKVTALLVDIHAWGPEAPFAAFVLATATENLTFALRWILFSITMVYGIVRFQVFSVDARAVGIAGAGALSMACFVGVGVAAAAFGPWPGAVLAVLLPVSLIGGLLLLRRRHPAARSSDYLHQRSLQVYHAYLAARLAEPGLGEAPEALEQVRARLGLTQREHDTLLAIAQTEESGARVKPVMLGRYEVVRRLGVGGYASVYLAKDRLDARLVVLKKLQEEWVGGAKALESALRETEVARRLSHPNVVAVHDMVRVNDGAVIVMEFLEGGALRGLLERDRRLSPEQATAILRDCLNALAAVHDAGIVHGDLKPENILLTSEGKAKLADFGAARATRAGRTLVRQAASGGDPATLLYMAPEQAKGGRATPQSDLYALGAIGYEMLTGKLFVEPEGAGHYELLRRIVEEPAERRLAALPASWAAFLGRALAHSPADRFRSAAEMLGALDLLGGVAPRGP